MNIKEFSEYFEIPYRTIQNWELWTRTAPGYLVKLIEYKLEKEGKITMYDIMTEYTNGMTEEESRRMIRKIASDE